MAKFPNLPRFLPFLIIGACGLPGCYYFPGVPSARTLPPGVQGLRLTIVDYTNVTVEDTGYQKGSDPKSPQLSASNTYSEVYTPGPGIYDFGVISPRLNLGFGLDFWSGAGVIGDLKYQWKSPKGPNDWLSAIDIQVMNDFGLGEGDFQLDGNAAEVLTFPVAKNFDLNVGARFGRNWNNNFAPANTDGGNLTSFFSPNPGPFSYIDYFFGATYFGQRSSHSIGLTVRFVLNQPYYLLDQSPQNEDEYSPFLNISYGIAFGGEAKR